MGDKVKKGGGTSNPASSLAGGPPAPSYPLPRAPGPGSGIASWSLIAEPMLVGGQVGLYVFHTKILDFLIWKLLNVVATQIW